MRRTFAWGKGRGALMSGCRNTHLHMTAPCPLPQAITALSMSVENIYEDFPKRSLNCHQRVLERRERDLFEI